jgi:chemotaxis protein MotB
MNKLTEFPTKLKLRQHGIIAAVILAGTAFFTLQGCTLKSTYNAKVTELEACQAHDAEMTDKLVQLQNTRNSLTEEIEARKKAAQHITEVYNELVSDLAGEIGSNQLTIKQMKSGVNVNLPHDVLFSSGSSELSPSGIKVLLKVGTELAEIPYQVIVGGFTDTVPVSAKLAEIYPTNWELAGARAARVVRGLEEAGVAKERLRAMSLGENNPVASNDTPEGRAKNRRIQIVLRPVVPGE